MRRLGVITGTAMLSALALSGCGGGGGATATIARIDFKSAAMANSSIPAVYTCDGKDVTPPLEWGAVPSGTGELALFVLGFTPNPARPGNYNASIEWAVAGVSPTLHKLNPGALPTGAHVGRSSRGKTAYDLCPKTTKKEQYQFELYAVSPGVTIPTPFEGLSVVSQLANSKPSGGPTLGHGVFVASYKRA